MAKKNKKISDKIVLSNEEYEVFQKMTNGPNEVTVIKVGNDKQTDKEQLEQCKEINKDLRRKVAISVKEKACFQADIDRLKLIAERDDDGMLSLMEGMERDINRLMKENSEYSDIGPELTGLRNKVRKLESKNKTLEKSLEDEVKTRDIQIEELTIQNKEFQTELDIRIQCDTRFNNMDL